MNVQCPNKHEQEEYGEHVVRVVCDKAIAPTTDTMRRLQETMPFRAKIAEGAPDNGYGRVAYVLCESEDRKRQAELAIEGDRGIANLIDSKRQWVALHSHIYYNLGKNVVSDQAWDRKARELARLQHTHGFDAGTWHNETFEEFTGNTGYHLPVTESIREEAQELFEDAEES